MTLCKHRVAMGENSTDLRFHNFALYYHVFHLLTVSIILFAFLCWVFGFKTRFNLISIEKGCTTIECMAGRLFSHH